MIPSYTMTSVDTAQAVRIVSRTRFSDVRQDGTHRATSFLGFIRGLL